MKVQVVQGEIQLFEVDTLIVNLFEGVTLPAGATGAVDSALNGAIVELISNGDLTGKAGEIVTLYPRSAIPAKRVIVTGLGPADKFDLEAARRAVGLAMTAARKAKSEHVATIVHGAGVARLDVQAAAQATAEGALLASYSFDAQKKRNDTHEISQLTLIEHDVTKVNAVKAGVKIAEGIAAGTFVARNLVNMPPNVATPIKMAEVAESIAQDHSYGITVGDRAWAEEFNMGAFLAVAKGAGDEPRFIVMEYNGDQSDLDTICLVGKGITFDTGGISIKPSANMGAMKSDMAGAAAVIGTMRAIADLDLPLRVIGITPCTENKPDADAYRPSDIITASNGKTIEIISTDAEGRMALADALVYAGRYDPDAVIDLATLTGSAVVALGKGVAASLFANDDDLSDALLSAGIATYERLWRLPLFDDYRESISTPVADMKNSGGRAGGVGTAAVFLEEFTDYKWAHLDIAGMALSDKGGAYVPAGATGYGVRLLTQFLLDRAAN